MSLVKTDRLEIAEALQKVTEDAAEEQRKAEEEAMAQQGMGMGGGMGMEQAMAGATMGAMMGPEAAAQMQSPIPGAGQGMEDLGSLLGALRRPAMTVAPMRGVERGAV